MRQIKSLKFHDAFDVWDVGSGDDIVEQNFEMWPILMNGNIVKFHHLLDTLGMLINDAYKG